MIPSVTAVVVTWNSARLLPDLIRTLNALKPVLHEAVISDNASTDDTRELVRRELPWVRLVENPRNGGFGYGCNRGMEEVESPFILFLNADARIESEAVETLSATLTADPAAAAVQPLIRLWDWPLVTLSAGAAMTRMGEGYDLDFMRFQPAPGTTPIPVPAVTAAVSLWRREALERVSGFDEGFFMYFEDLDLCLRLRAGGCRFLLDPSAGAEHRMGASSTRTRALAWELESAAVIGRRYLGGGGCRLPKGWRSRELRIRFSMLRRGRSFRWRMAAIRKASVRSLDPVALPPGELAWLIAPRPLREPVERLPLLTREPVDDRRMVLRGPGWDAAGATTHCGFGGLFLPSTGGGLQVTLRRLDGPCSAALWLDDGFVTRCLLTGDHPETLSARIPRGSARVYVVPDRREARVVLDRCRFIPDP
jgi:N-acetylglucosaminyl-diphospho-decaprenol L-rhamnosyltransferase